MEGLVGKKLFVLVGTEVSLPMSTLWLGTLKQSDYDDWFNGRSRLLLHEVRSLIIQPVAAGKIKMSVGPPYLGDTPGTSIAVDPISVEILGDVASDASGINTCTGNGQLYRAYSDAVTAYRAALSGISIAHGMQDIPPQGNITPFPPRK